MMLDGLDDFGVGERGDVAWAGEVGDAGDDTAHDLARAGLGHVGHDPDVLRPGDLADQAFWADFDLRDRPAVYKAPALLTELRRRPRDGRDSRLGQYLVLQT